MRQPRFPLYGQILLWFFLNLALVGAVVFVILKYQFNVGIDSLLTGKVEERMEAIGETMSAELRQVPRDGWEDIVDRYEDAYRVRFQVLRPDGEQAFEGARADIPDGLREVLGEMFPPRRDDPPTMRPPGAGPPERRGPGGRDPRGAPRGGARGPVRPRTIYQDRAGEPPQYWAAVHVLLAGGDVPHPPDGIIVASSARPSGNRVFVDWRPWFWTVLAVLAVSALIWLPFVHRVTQRLRRLTDAAESISEGEFDVEVASERGDELGRLSRAVQRMAQRLDEYVAGQSRFIGDIAHELCSPLVRVRMSVGILEQRLPESEHGKLAALDEEVGELSQLVNELLDFSKASISPGTLPKEEVRLPEFLTEMSRREGAGANVDLSVNKGLAMHTNRDLLRRAFGNVVRNAVRYAGDAGPILLKAERGGDGIRITVLDGGPGVPKEWLEKIFEPFARPERARTREGGGAGLGLAIARTCTESLNGTIRGWNRPEGGFAVELFFPNS